MQKNNTLLYTPTPSSLVFLFLAAKELGDFERLLYEM